MVEMMLMISEICIYWCEECPCVFISNKESSIGREGTK